jgi:hypothetical protein
MDIKEVMELLGERTFFSVTFIKKDNSIRVLNGLTGVKKHLKGGELPYDPIAKGLIPVYDVQSEGYRMVNSQTVLEIKSDKKVYTIKDGAVVSISES